MRKLYKKPIPQIEVEADLRFALKELKFYFKRSLENKFKIIITDEVLSILEFNKGSSIYNTQQFLKKFEDVDNDEKKTKTTDSD